jgi:hypothetical protein
MGRGICKNGGPSSNPVCRRIPSARRRNPVCSYRLLAVGDDLLLQTSFATKLFSPLTCEEREIGAAMVSPETLVYRGNTMYSAWQWIDEVNSHDQRVRPDDGHTAPPGSQSLVLHARRGRRGRPLLHHRPSGDARSVRAAGRCRAQPKPARKGPVVLACVMRALAPGARGATVCPCAGRRQRARPSPARTYPAPTDADRPGGMCNGSPGGWLGHPERGLSPGDRTKLHSTRPVTKLCTDRPGPLSLS